MMSPQQSQQNLLNMKARQCLYAILAWLRAETNVQYPVTIGIEEEDAAAARENAEMSKTAADLVFDLCGDLPAMIVSSDYPQGTLSATFSTRKPSLDAPTTPSQRRPIPPSPIWKEMTPAINELSELTPDEARRDGWTVEQDNGDWIIRDPVGRIAMKWKLAHTVGVRTEQDVWQALCRREE